MPGSLAPVGRQRVFSNLGVVAPGALLHTYLGGTPATPQATYSDQALTIPNANPIVASASGLFGPIYLTPSAAYYLVLTEANGTAIWDQDYLGNDLAVAPVITTAIAAAVAPVVQTVSLTGAIELTLPAGCTLVRLTNAALVTISGINLLSVRTGQQLIIESAGAGQVDLLHQSGLSAAPLRLLNIATSALTSLAPGSGRAIYVYDGVTSRWDLVSHEQGAWITPTFSGANFTGIGAMTWTVDAGDVTLCKYWLRERSLSVVFTLLTTSVGGVANVGLVIGMGAMGGFVQAANTQYGLYSRSDNGGAEGVALLQPVNGLSLSNGQTVFTVNWTAAANTTAVRGSATFEVT